MRVFLHTFGCKSNQYDTERVRQELVARGATIVDDAAAADAAVVNSCTVTHVGEAKLRGLVRRLERQRKGINTVVMGCAAALDDGTIAGLPGVRAVVGGADVGTVVQALGFEEGSVDPVLRSFTSGARAWVKVQDGCDEHCTFCATTTARGRNRSRPPEEIIEEARGLADGHDELVLTGVHIGTYGRDRGGPSLGRLVHRLIEAVPRVRFRLSSVEATELDEWLIEAMATAPDRLAPHLHAPLQSGSDPVLKRMGRHWYTAEAYRARCEQLAERVAPLGLGADIIVGFPGETAADHAATRRLVEELPFTYLHVFPYSPRPTASAPRLGGALPPPQASERALELRALAREKGTAARAARVGQEADWVRLDRHRGRWRGLTGDYLDVYLPSDPATDRRARVTVTGREDGALVGQMLTVSV